MIQPAPAKGQRREPAARRGTRLHPPHPPRRHGPRLDAATAWVLAILLATIALGPARHGDRPMLVGLLAAFAALVSIPGSRRLVAVCLERAVDSLRRFAREGGRIPWAPAVALVGLPFAALNLAHGTWLGSVDTRPVIPTAVSLARDGDWDVSELARARGGDLLPAPGGNLYQCFERSGERVHSAFPLGMTPFAIAVVAPARALGADLELRPVHVALERIAATLVAGATLTLFYLVALRLGSPLAAAVATAFLATGSGVLTTVGLALWQHGGVTTWLLLALLVEFAAVDGRPRLPGTLLQGLAGGMMLSCRPTAALLVGLLGLWILARSPGRAVAFGAGAIAGYAPWLALNLALYGNVLGPRWVNVNAGGQNWDFFRPATLYGVLLCPARGLFVYQPWALLALGTAVPEIRRRASLLPGPRGWIPFAAAASVAHVYVIGSWRDWSGGYCWGSRLLTDILPLVGLLAMPAIAVLARSRPGHLVLLGLALLAAATHWPAILANAGRWNYVTDHAADLWSWSKAPFLYRP